MCLPLPCLKSVVFIGAFLSILISLGLLGLTIYVTFQKQEIIHGSSEQFVNGVLIGFYVSSGVFLMLGVAGLTGSMTGINRKESFTGKCLLWFYVIGILLFLIILSGLGTFFFVGSTIIFGPNCTVGSTTKLIAELYNHSQTVNQYFCQNKCPCYITPGSDLDVKMRTSGRYTVTNNPSAADRYQKCQNQSKTTNLQDSLLMVTLQKVLGCAGWCNNETMLYYRFYGINECTTANCLKELTTCHDSFKHFLDKSGMTIGIAFSVAALICLLNILAVCCIFNHSSKRSDDDESYAKMMQQPQQR